MNENGASSVEEWPETASWDGGSTYCETCGTNFDEAEFYFEEGTFYGRLSLGCYSGSSVEVEPGDWKSIGDWLNNHTHLKGWEAFARDVRALWEKHDVTRTDSRTEGSN